MVPLGPRPKSNCITKIFSLWTRAKFVYPSSYSADHVENDVQWKLFKTDGVLLEEFQERYVSRKPPPLQTEIAGMKWFPYGDFSVEDANRASYICELAELSKTVVNADTDNLLGLSEQVST